MGPGRRGLGPVGKPVGLCSACVVAPSPPPPGRTCLLDGVTLNEEDRQNIQSKKKAVDLL